MATPTGNGIHFNGIVHRPIRPDIIEAEVYRYRLPDCTISMKFRSGTRRIQADELHQQFRRGLIVRRRRRHLLSLLVVRHIIQCQHLG